MKKERHKFGEASWHEAATKLVNTQYSNRARGTWKEESREIPYRLLEDACQGQSVSIPNTARGWSLREDAGEECAVRMYRVTNRLMEAARGVDAAEVIAYMESLWRNPHDER